MKADCGLYGGLAGAAERSRSLEAFGYDGAIAVEVNSDPFLPLSIAAEHTERIDLMTGISVAFARNPMNMAQIGHDLNQFSRGRVVLGLGSQIKPHITKRFSMPWSKPAARMREYILAMRAIWQCWHEDAPLDFRGEFYQHTLMTPMFVPGEKQYGAPRVFLAAVGPKMTEVAGEVADGLIVHAFTTPEYMRNVTLPALERGLAKAGRSRADFEISSPTFVVTGRDEREFAAKRQATAQQIAFYGSTPAYRPVLEEHGWGELQQELNLLSKQGKWVEMADLVGEDIIEAFCVVSDDPGKVGTLLRARLDGIADRVSCLFELPSKELQRQAVDAIRG